VQYSCRVGHTLTAQALLAGQTESLESALWAALRALEDREELLRRIADRARRQGNTRTMEHFEQRANQAAARAALVRTALLEAEGLSERSGKHA
jgi:two-component system chemotaxis response regulator CheB